MFRTTTPKRQPAPLRPQERTYVVLAVGAAPGAARPLGTVDAACRGAARALACVLHGDVLPSRLRVVAAGSAPGDLVARALACDGRAVA
jgi:hypothetical protein